MDRPSDTPTVAMMRSIIADHDREAHLTSISNYWKNEQDSEQCYNSHQNNCTATQSA